MGKFFIFIAFLLLTGMSVVQAQPRTISGKVTAKDDGNALPGVTVVVKGTTVGTTTDADGIYRMIVPARYTTIVFSFIGMKTKEVEVGTSDVINIILETDILKLDQVVVTAIGIKRETKALGYSVQEIGGDQLERAKSTNVVNDLSGQVAGVQITSSAGVAGASSFITIRGPKSILGDNQPLFVVDGVPIDNSQEYSGNPDDGTNNLTTGVAYSNRAIDLNPEDIESISVLKGGAATALYGLRAANGVVIITTKKGAGVTGKGGKVNVEYSTYYTFDYVNKLPKLQNKWGQGSAGKYNTTTTSSWGPMLDTMRYDGSTTYLRDKNGKLVGEHAPTAKANMPANAYDNLGTFFQTGHTYNNAVNLGGGTADANYYLSFSNNTTQGIVPLNTYSKTTFKISGESKLSDKFSISGTANYLRSGGDRIQQGSNLSGIMLGLLRTTPSFDNSNGYSDPAHTNEAYMYPDETQRAYSTAYDNPYWSVNQNKFRDDVDRILGNVTLNYLPYEWLNLTYRLGEDQWTDRRQGHFAINSSAFPQGQIQDDHHYNRDLNSDLIATLHKTLTKAIDLNLIVGNNVFQSKNQQLYDQGDIIQIPDFYHISNTSSQLIREISTEYRTAAFYGDLGLAYKSMLFVDITGRNEWSTTLPKGNNSFFYPSFSGGFVFTELDPLKGIKDILAFGKLRASYTIIANIAPPYYTSTTYTLATYNDGWTNGISFPFKGVAGFINGDVLGNDKLKPEKEKSFEIGTDLRFFKNRIGLDLSYYDNKNEDLILQVPQQGSNGYVAAVLNAASMENKGIEILLNLGVIRMKDFSWDLTINYTKNTNKVIDLAPGVDNVTLGGFTGIDVRVVKGLPYGSIFSTTFVKDTLTGKVIINDDTNSAGYGYPVLATNQKAIGSIQPKWTMGITNEFRYKNWNLSFLIDIKRGGLMWDGTRARLTRLGTAEGTSDRGTSVIFDGLKGKVTDDNHYTIDGTNDISAVKNQNYYTTLESDVGSQELFTEKTDWVRLRQITLTYTFNPKIMGKSWFKGIDIYFTGTNLFLSTPYKGIDPETNLYGASNTQGIDYFNMPNTKSYIFGLKLKI